MKERIQEILNDRLLEEDDYDSYASLRMDTAATADEDMSLDEAYQTLKNEPKFSEKSLQDKRLKELKSLFEDSKLESIQNRIMRQKSLLGFIDEKDPATLNKYHFEIYNYCNETLSHDLHEKEMEKIAWSLLKKSTLTQCLVVIRNYSYQRPSKTIGYTYGLIYYFEDNKLLEKYFLDLAHKLYTTAESDITFGANNLYFAHEQGIDDINEQEKLELKKLTVSQYVKNHLYLNPDNLLVLFASRPNNPKILRYLIRLAGKLKIDFIKVIHNCLCQAIKKECLSNVKAILSEYKGIAVNFNFGASQVNLSSFFHNDTLNTASPLIDICLLFDEYDNAIKDKLEEFGFDIYMNRPEENKDEKCWNSSQTQRQIVTLVLIEIFKKKDFYQVNNKYFYNRLISSLNNSLSGNKYLSVVFYKRNLDIFKYADLEKIKSLHHYHAIFQVKRNIKTVFGIFKIFKSRGFLPFWYNAINIETASLMNGIASMENDKDAGILAYITDQVVETISLFLSSGVCLLVMEYFLPSLFEKIAAKMEKIHYYSRLESTKNMVCIRYFNVPQQATGSADCGYWTLFHALNFLTDVCHPYSQTPTISLKDLGVPFLCFKGLVKNILSKRNEDLTAVDLDRILKRAAAGNEEKLVKVFPKLCEQLSMMNECAGIPIYTIINSLTASEELKLEKSSTFGGYLPHLKMQIAINFYVLSQYRDQPRLHFIFFGTQGHWHVQVLCISYFSPGTINFYRIDSDPAAISAEMLQQINLHLQDLLDNPEAYAKNVAEEVIPPIHHDLIEFDKILQASPAKITNQLKIIYKHCGLIHKFFSTFGKLPFAKKYLPVLSLAKKIVQRLDKEYPDFTPFSHQFSTLYHLSQDEKSLNIRIFPGNKVKKLLSETQDSTHSASIFQ